MAPQRLLKPEPVTSRTDILALIGSSTPIGSVLAWIDADANRLHWRDRDTGQNLLDLALATEQLELALLWLDRHLAADVAVKHEQPGNRQRFPSQSDSYERAVKQIVALLRQ